MTDIPVEIFLCWRADCCVVQFKGVQQFPFNACPVCRTTGTLKVVSDTKEQ